MQVQPFPGGHAVVFDSKNATDRRAIMASLGRLCGATPLSDAKAEVARYEFQLAQHDRINNGREPAPAFRHVRPQLEAKLAEASAHLAQLENA